MGESSDCINALSTTSGESDRRLLVFADDWGRHPSSAQHLIRQLLSRYEVGWVDTIGMRTPSWSWATWHRGAEKLTRWMASRRTSDEECLPQNPTVLRPKMWPWFTRSWDRMVNRRLLLSQLTGWCRSGSLPTAITTLPITADLMGPLPASRWVYYCVDDFSQWPGVDQRTMAVMERRVIERSETIICASRELQSRMSNLGREAKLLTHGVDLDVWRHPQPSSFTRELASLERPWIVFWGLIDRRMDLEFVRTLAQRLERGTILFIGPESDPDPDLVQIPRVRRSASQPFHVLSAIADESTVLVMPYADLPVTRAMQPLKLLEYLATGKPVVVRKLPATEEWVDCLDAVSSAEEFAETVMRRAATGIPQSQLAARARLSNESWLAKARQFEEWLSG